MIEYGWSFTAKLDSVLLPPRQTVNFSPLCIYHIKNKSEFLHKKMEYILREKQGCLRTGKGVKCHVTASTILPQIEGNCLLMHFAVLLTVLFCTAGQTSLRPQNPWQSRHLTEYNKSVHAQWDSMSGFLQLSYVLKVRLLKAFLLLVVGHSGGLSHVDSVRLINNIQVASFSSMEILKIS